MINSNDGGADVSFNGGRSWTEQDQATAQFYRVTVDNDFPYNVYGAQQDNSTVRIASRTTEGGITESTGMTSAAVNQAGLRPHRRFLNCLCGLLRRIADAA